MIDSGNKSLTGIFNCYLAMESVSVVVLVLVVEAVESLFACFCFSTRPLAHERNRTDNNRSRERVFFILWVFKGCFKMVYNSRI
jgi:hypothetical protein